jgi:hypothetical protein
MAKKLNIDPSQLLHKDLGKSASFIKPVSSSNESDTEREIRVATKFKSMTPSERGTLFKQNPESYKYHLESFNKHRNALNKSQVSEKPKEKESKITQWDVLRGVKSLGIASTVGNGSFTPPKPPKGRNYVNPETRKKIKASLPNELSMSSYDKDITAKSYGTSRFKTNLFHYITADYGRTGKSMHEITTEKYISQGLNHKDAVRRSLDTYLKKTVYAAQNKGERGSLIAELEFHRSPSFKMLANKAFKEKDIHAFQKLSDIVQEKIESTPKQVNRGALITHINFEKQPQKTKDLQMKAMDQTARAISLAKSKGLMPVSQDELVKRGIIKLSK